LTDRELRPYRLQLRTSFRGLTFRRGCLVSGIHGWGEFAPFEDYDVAADARWLECALEQADGRWPHPVREAVEVNAIIPEVGPDEAARMAVESGCRTIKIKVGDQGGGPRVAAVRAALPDVALRVDVNAGWTVDRAEMELAALEPLTIEYAEQPVRTFDEMVELRRRTTVPLAADELIRIDRRFDDVARAADVAVLKVPTLGGVARTVQIAQRVGVPVVISSALDSSIGLAAGLAAACCLPQPPLACGLGTGALFAEDTTESLRPSGGRLGWPAYPQPFEDLPSAHEDLRYWQQRIDDASHYAGLG
jgi:O-succinylbenzoate synthase